MKVTFHYLNLILVNGLRLRLKESRCVRDTLGFQKTERTLGKV